ncbi:MAG TPA: helix-turn-helix domain-containing protein [Abditibacteriaceae bacterium]|jgi:excisionase family DNA binding protein
MNKSEAAEFLGVSVRAVERYASAGKLSSRYVRGKTGQVLDFEQADLEAFKAQLETPIEKGTTSHATPRQGEAATSDDTNALATLDGSLNGASPLAVQRFFEILAGMSDKSRQGATVPVEARLFLTVQEAATLAGVGKSAIESAIKSGYIKAHSGLGRGRRVKRVDVEKWATKL